MTDAAQGRPSTPGHGPARPTRRTPSVPVATVARRAILAALAESSAFVTAQALHARLTAEGHRMGLATVYRALRIYADIGDIDRTRAEDGTVLFRYRPDPGHHHYLRCRSCGYSVPIHSEPFEAWTATIGSRHDFTDLTHTVEVLGTCSSCWMHRGEG
ncbi:Fur family transcriptional regulator [Pseudonocardia xinjiangensis]|uniref:Fur family transcriptional regulator n=1 Tax=Pseudonocardia xinjiangensis TaxID=75289 RepID=UPI003D8B83CE